MPLPVIVLNCGSGRERERQRETTATLFMQPRVFAFKQWHRGLSRIARLWIIHSCRTVCDAPFALPCRGSFVVPPYISRLISHDVPHNTASPRRRQDTIERDFLLESIHRPLKLREPFLLVSLTTSLFPNIFIGLLKLRKKFSNLFSQIFPRDFCEHLASAC